jgi:hypothetical protein
MNAGAKHQDPRFYLVLICSVLTDIQERVNQAMF